jgi:uncharacterized protein (UPF0276 family)
LNTSSLSSKPDACIGVGLRHLHYDEALAHNQSQTPIDFVEIHAENFFAKGGITQALLSDVCEHYQLSVHGTSLRLGSNLPLPQQTLSQFAELVKSTQPKLVSEHLCFNRAMIDDKIYHSGDLLPIAFNEASLAQTVSNIQQVQEAIGRALLIENLSAYLNISEMDPDSRDTMTEPEFLLRLCEMAGCGMLLDLNNLIVNALNQKHADPIDAVLGHVKQLPKHLVGEIHLAGFSEQKVAGFIVDDHGQAVSQQCWEVYRQTIKRFPSVPTLIEWDTNLPPWETLVDQANKARDIALQQK